MIGVARNVQLHVAALEHPGADVDAVGSKGQTAASDIGVARERAVGEQGGGAVKLLRCFRADDINAAFAPENID